MRFSNTEESASDARNVVALGFANTEDGTYYSGNVVALVCANTEFIAHGGSG